MNNQAELSQRLVVGAILIFVAVAEIWLGGVAFWILVTIGGLVMLSEFSGLLKSSTQDTRLALFAFCIPLGILSPLAAGPHYLGIGLIFGTAVAVYAVTRKAGLGAGLVYVGLPAFALLWLRDRSGDGLLLSFWALSLVWATDIGAYFAGRAIGGPKLAPRISPNKTWAGLGGGVIAALLLGWALSHWAGLPRGLALAAVPLAVLAQMGDLFQSWMKRRAGVKDSGRLLPGHGGVLDRLDGLVTSVPIAALIVALGFSQ